LVRRGVVRPLRGARHPRHRGRPRPAGMSAPTHPLATVGRVPTAKLLARLVEALALYVAAMKLPPEAAAIKRAQVPGHLRDPSARAVMADTNTGELAGFGYGVAGPALAGPIVRDLRAACAAGLPAPGPRPHMQLADLER